MDFNKKAISIQDQIELLKSRGLKFIDEYKAGSFLSNVSYYRIRAYTYPFQDNDNSNHIFTRDITFEEIIELYDFDSRLRILIFESIEKIEIALRTQIIYNYSITHGSHWHLDPTLFTNSIKFLEDLESLEREILRSKETFIEHYINTYTNPIEPPSWMSLEVTSMGLLSKIFTNLKNNKCKDSITKYFALKDVHILENWMRCFSLIRNICAHHSRVWNRRITKMTIPKKPLNIYIKNNNLLQYKIYLYLVNIYYILKIVDPLNNFRNRLLEIMHSCPLAQEKEMGFPKNWVEDEYWQ